MSNIARIEFTALDLSGDNYLEWITDVEIHLDAMNLGDSIIENNAASQQDRAKTMIFLRRHLHENLKAEYLTVKDPYILWKNLRERFGHLKEIMLPNARYKWMHLRLQDFKTVGEYNSAIFRITSQLKLCGEKITDVDMLEKTFSTFHASNMILQQQYRERGFKRYSELISCLLIAEQNNQLLLKNHQSRPTGSTPFPEANGTSKGKEHATFPEVNVVTQNNRGHKNYRGRGRGRGRNQNTWYRNGYNNNNNNDKKATVHHQKWESNKGKDSQALSVKGKETTCFRCGMTGHWSRTCRTSKHLVDLYQASLKDKEKCVETNFVNQNDQSDNTHMDISNFFDTPEENLNSIFGD